MRDEGEPGDPPVAHELPAELLDEPVVPAGTAAETDGAIAVEPPTPAAPSIAADSSPAAERIRLYEQRQASDAASLARTLRRVRGVVELVLGALVLGFVWGPAQAVFAPSRELAAFTARGDATLLTSWWRIDIDTRLLGDTSTYWQDFAQPELCTRFRLDSRIPWTTGVACRRWTGLPEPSLLWSVGREAPELPVRWRDADDRLMLDLRLSRRAYRWLAMHEAREWPLLAQDDETRAKEKTGSELAALLIRADEPLELALEQWRPEAPTSAAMAYDPAHPTRMAPVSMLDSAKPKIWQIVLVGIPALLGLGLWIAGCRHLLADRRLAWRALALVATLVTLPWWSRALAHSLRFLYDPAENALAGFAAGVATPPPRLVLRDPDWHGESDDVLRPINPATSRYADILGGLVIRKPDGAPSEDDLLRELSESIAAQVELWPDERIVPMLIALDHHARLADHSADFLVLDAVRRASLDERRSPGLRETASNVLFWVALGAAPRPDEVAGAERMKLWEALYDHPDPAVRNVARK